MKKILLAFAVFLAAVSFSSKASAVVDVDARYWFTNLSSDITASSGSIAGTNVDFVNDLGVDETKGFVEGRITLELGSHKIRYAFVPLKWDATSTLAQQVIFGGKTYTASTPVESELNVNYHRLGYEYDIIDMLDNHLGFIFELKYFDGNARLKATSLGLDENENFNVPIPTVGVSAQVSLPFLFSVGGEVTGITLGGNAYLVDGEAAFNFKPAPFVVVSGGYRLFKIHVEKDLDKGDLTVKGPFLNVRADF
ncbi:MAG: hypothetical protein ACE5GY_00220 [Thermodesulfobacteriota bacterium]